MSSNTRVLLFAILLGATCSALLAGVSRLTEPNRIANEEAEAVENILAALQVPLDANAGPDEILDVFTSVVSVKELGTISQFEYRTDAGLQAVAVPVRGPGLWGPVEGVLAMESDMQTIRGVRFYKQEETPGLGGEIGSQWFQNQFEGKKIVDENGVPGVRVVQSGDTTGQNVVDAVTGATMTSQRVESMLNDVIAAWTGEM